MTIKYGLDDFSHLKKESPDLNLKFFSINKKTTLKKKILIISGGSRNGNHLITSILDNHPQLPYSPGEDHLLSQLFWKFLIEKNVIQKKLKNKNLTRYIKELSGVKFDKWKKISSGKINKKNWAGNHKKGFVPTIEYPNQKIDINYKEYENKILLNFQNLKKRNFENIFEKYMAAFSCLTHVNKNSKYDYLYANSGLRRELYLLLKKKYDVKIIVPVRKFETFYPSKVVARYLNKNQKRKKKLLNHGYLQEAWMHWRNKTIDYLILKKLYPKKILIVKFEDLSKKSNNLYLKKICKFLNINFSKNLKKKTSHGKEIMPNTSYGSLYQKTVRKKLVEKNIQLPKEYKSIYKIVDEYSY